MNKAKYFQEGAFLAWEDMEKHLATAAKIEAGMQKTLKMIERPTQEISMTNNDEMKLQLRALELEEKKFEHQKFMDLAFLELRRLEQGQIPNNVQSIKDFVK